MKQVLEKQTVVLEKIEKVLSQDRLIQLSQAAQERRAERDSIKGQYSLDDKLASIQAELKKALLDKTGEGLNSNFAKLFEEVKKQTKIMSKLTPEQGKAILDKSRERREFKTLGSRLQGVKESTKDLFTARGFLDKTGIVKRGSGGMLSEYLDAKEDTKKYAKLRVEAGDPTVKLHGVKKATQIFEKQRREQQSLRREQGTAERKIATYRAAGISEKQIASSPESKKLQETAVKLAKVDPALRPDGFDTKTGMIATVAPVKQDSKTVVAKPPESVKKYDKNTTPKLVALSKQDSKKVSAVKQDKNSTVIKQPINTFYSAKQEKSALVAAPLKQEKSALVAAPVTQEKSAARSTPNVLSKVISAAVSKQEGNAQTQASKEGSTKKAMTAENAVSQEDALETRRANQRQIELLEKIEENTSALSSTTSKTTVKPKEEKSGGGLLSTITGFLGDGLMTALKSMFSLKNILKALGKIALPAMIIGSLVNGIMDGFNTFMETGSIGEALISGLGGVLKFLSFGLFDAETVRNVVESVSKFVDEYIITPVKEFFSFIGDVFEKNIAQPLSEFFAPLTVFFKTVKDQMMSMMENIGIPEIKFTIPIIDKKVSIGPFYPFKQSAAAPVDANSRGAASPESTETAKVVGAGKTETAMPDKSVRSTVLSNKSESTIKIAGKPVGEKLTDEQVAVMELSMSSGNKYPVEIMQKYEAQRKTSATNLQAPSTAPSNAVYNKSAENVAASSSSSQQPIIISAPTTNNSTSKQNIAMPKPIRNDDSGFNRYLASHSAII